MKICNSMNESKIITLDKRSHICFKKDIPHDTIYVEFRKMQTHLQGQEVDLWLPGVGGLPRDTRQPLEGVMCLLS